MDGGIVAVYAEGRFSLSKLISNEAVQLCKPIDGPIYVIFYLHPASLLRICVLYYNGNLTALEPDGISYEFPPHNLIILSWP